MKFRTFFVCLVSVGAAWMFSGCDGEENSLADTFTDSSPQQGFSWEGFKDPFLAAQLIVDWEHPREVETFPEELHATPGGKRVYEYPVSFKGKGILEQGSKKLYFRYRMLAFGNDDGVWSYTLVKYLSADQKSLAEVGYEQKAEFSGTVTYYPIDGAPTRLEAYEKGVLLDTRTDEATGSSIALKEDSSFCDQGCFKTVLVYRYTDYYISVNGGEFSYSYSVYEGMTYERVWVSGTGGSGNYHSHFDDPHGPGLSTDNHPEEVILDPSFIGTKAECVYKKLKELGGDLFKKTIGAFIDDPNYNLILKVGECSYTDDACTNASDIENIVITIEDVNTNPISLAQLILHEAIHAELYRYVSKYQSGVDPNNRSRLFQLYTYYKNIERPGNIQHIYMTENYINPIAMALRELDGNKFPSDYYKAFAWDGLRIWDANNLLSMEENLSYEEYRKIVINNSSIPCH